MSDDELFFGSDEEEVLHDSNDELEDVLNEDDVVSEAGEDCRSGEISDEEIEKDNNEDDLLNNDQVLVRSKSNLTFTSGGTKSSKSDSKVKTNRKKKVEMHPALEKLYISAKKEQKLLKKTPALVEVACTDLPLSSAPTKPFKRFKTTVTEKLSRPIGFKGDEDFEKRLETSKAKVFDIERTFLMKQTRFIPFGPPNMYTNTWEFYTKPTTICCWWCSETFENPPIPMPIRFHDCGEKSYWQITGIFCTPSCMLANSCRHRKSEALARVFLKKAYSLKTLGIQRAPDPLSLKKFGGLYTIEQFRATGGSNIATVAQNMPFVPVSAGLCEIENFVTVIKEEGGVELAKKRFNGRAIFGSNIVPNLSSSIYVQETPFARAPTIEQQIRQSDSKLRLQQAQATKRVNILSFMNVTKQGEKKI